jgi:DnaK suppressor protein
MVARRKVKSKTQRHAELRKMLEERREALRVQVHGKIKDVRAQHRHDSDVPGQGDMLEIDIREDTDLTLIQMTSETLAKIDVALSRLEQGAYGNCIECGSEIAEARLRALPFAIRCRACEETRERARHASNRAGYDIFDPL